jgi:hydroxymethylpyrimidine pyrophosphatase-like HAD family hydrolase
VAPLERALESEAPIQMMLCGPVERMREAEAHLLSDARVTQVDGKGEPGIEVMLHRTEYPHRDLCILDILPCGCSKASAQLHLAGARGFQAGAILAIGDNWNDLPMFQIAGEAAVMANAPEELRAYAQARGWTMAPGNDEDGVAAVIEAALSR